MAVRIGVVAGGKVELRAGVDKRGHSIRRGTIHADLAVRIQGHKAESGIHLWIHHGHVELVVVSDGLPIIHGGATHGISADAQAGIFNGLHIHHILKVSHVVVHVVVLHAALVQHARDRCPLHAFQPGAQVLVRAASNPIGGLSIGRSTGRRVVFEAAIAGRIMGRGNHNAIGARVGQDGMADRRGRRVAAALIDANLHPIGQQHLKGGDHGRFGQRVGISADENRPSNALFRAVIHNGLGNR